MSEPAGGLHETVIVWNVVAEPFSSGDGKPSMVHQAEAIGTACETDNNPRAALRMVMVVD